MGLPFLHSTVPCISPDTDFLSLEQLLWCSQVMHLGRDCRQAMDQAALTIHSHWEKFD